MERLRVKAFSALLFEKIDRQTRIKPMIQNQLAYTKLRMLRIWVREFKKSVTLNKKQ